MSKSCKGLLKELYACLEKSDCVQVHNHTVVACAKMEQGLTDECKGLRYTYAHCKKGMLDMRTRIRGNRGY